MGLVYVLRDILDAHAKSGLVTELIARMGGHAKCLMARASARIAFTVITVRTRIFVAAKMIPTATHLKEGASTAVANASHQSLETSVKTQDALT